MTSVRPLLGSCRVVETIPADFDIIAEEVPGVDQVAPVLAPVTDSDTHLHMVRLRRRFVLF